MGVTIRKRGKKWYVFVNYLGKRKAKCVGTRAAAEEVKRVLEAKLTLGDMGIFEERDAQVPTFDKYAADWMKNYVLVECKRSTADGYQGVLRLYLLPRFTKKRLDQIKRDDIRAMISKLIGRDLSRNTIRNALCVVQRMFNQAMESGIIEANPAVRLGRFTRTAKGTERQGTALKTVEVKSFLDCSQEVCPDYFPFILVAVRAGLSRGELVSLQWGDLQFGKDEQDPNRFFFIQHNYVRR